jgi:hypothetical protein
MKLTYTCLSLLQLFRFTVNLIFCAVRGSPNLRSTRWHTNTVLSKGLWTDVLWLLPASLVTADIVPGVHT